MVESLTTFEADHYEACLIGCANYDKSRVDSNSNKEYHNIPTAKLDVEIMARGMAKFGFFKPRKLIDPIIELDVYFNSLEEILKRREKSGKKTVLFCYYSGHGVMNTQALIVLNKSTNFYYPLQEKLTFLSSLKGVYVIGVFDSCRAEIQNPFST